MSARNLTPSPSRSNAAPGFWVLVVLCCAILLGSGAARAWQARRVAQRLDDGRRGPRVDLETIPRAIGTWQGAPTVIDEQIARGTGADQIVTRRYVNQDTGVAVDVILLYGPAAEMSIHSPEVCYPSAGYAPVGGAAGKIVKTEGADVPFRSLVYRKGEGASADLQEVYYTWRYDDRWSPEVGIRKRFERIPSMYKVHVARRLTERERRDVGNPCEAFLAALLPELQRRMTSPSGGSEP
jgi:Protein of unknown function (DUF3485)